MKTTFNDGNQCVSTGLPCIGAVHFSYPGPGCVLSLVLPRTASYTRPIAGPFPAGRGAPGPTGCASPGCSRHWRCGQSYQAGRLHPASQGHLNQERDRVSMEQHHEPHTLTHKYWGRTRTSSRQENKSTYCTVKELLLGHLHFHHPCKSNTQRKVMCEVWSQKIA